MRYNINYFNDSGQQFLPAKKIKDSVAAVFEGEKAESAEVNVIVLDDVKIHDMNKKFLSHDYPTDVITFPLGEGTEIEGEIYISADTARKQAEEYNVSFTNELLRLAVHGALHLMGYDDATDEERGRMHELENKYINHG